MWLDICIRLCDWTKSLLVNLVGVCITLSIRSSDLVVLGLPVLKRRSLGRGDPKLSLLRLWGQSIHLVQLLSYVTLNVSELQEFGLFLRG